MLWNHAPVKACLKGVRTIEEEKRTTRCTCCDRQGGCGRRLSHMSSPIGTSKMGLRWRRLYHVFWTYFWLQRADRTGAGDWVIELLACLYIFPSCFHFISSLSSPKKLQCITVALLSVHIIANGLQTQRRTSNSALAYASYTDECITSRRQRYPLTFRPTQCVTMETRCSFLLILLSFRSVSNLIRPNTTY